jgi:hypothetical protein
MKNTEWLVRWNDWYDRAPADWRFLMVLSPLLALGAINLLLTISSGFPFALLLLLGILFVAAVRVPYSRGWLASADHKPTTTPAATPLQIDPGHWVIDLNHRYEALPEAQRFWVYPAILVVAGLINMMLTIGVGFPFGLLVLVVLLALVAVRAPFVVGLFKTANATGSEVGQVSLYPAAVEHSPTQALASEQPVAAPPVAVPPATVQTTDDAHPPLEHPTDRGHEPGSPPPLPD